MPNMASGQMSSRNSSMPAPPNILMIETDNIKPYSTTPYDKVAAEYVAVARKANLPGSVIAMEALSGPNRAQYLFAHDSFDDMQQQEDITMKDATATAAFAHLDSLENPYVAEVHNVIWHYREDLSNNAAGADIAHCRYWETIVFHIKPGHDQQFEENAKMYRDAYAKIGVNLPWATFEAEMGATDSYVVILPMKSLKEEDEGLARQKTVMDAFGSDGMHHLEETARDAYASVEDTLWEVNPKTSYVTKEMMAANPDFWNPKPAAPMTKGTMVKPAMKPAPKPATP
ncbi:MAG: hypothetical protein WBF06_17425 [Candidatus Acidiferrales bacterium]